MKKNSSIYVAGHNGFIGSAIVRRLKRAGYEDIVVRSREKLDLTDQKAVEKFFAKERPEYVFLAAAKVGGIYANDSRPAEFIFDNIMIEANVIGSARRYGVKKLLFLASSCIYPKGCGQPMRESYILAGPLEPTNEPFAIAKLAGIGMCQAYNRQYGTKFISAIPANVYGINDNFGEDAHVLPSLIKKFHAAGGRGSVTVWGSGKPKREFLYVDDLADACVFLMERYDSSEVINIGTGTGTSVRELAESIARMTCFKGKIIYDKKRPDGNPERLLDSAKINSLGWKAKMDLKEGLILTYGHFKKG